MIRTYSSPHSYLAVALGDIDAQRLRDAGLWIKGPHGPFNQEPDAEPAERPTSLSLLEVTAVLYGCEVEGITTYRVGVTDPTPLDCEAEKFLF